MRRSLLVEDVIAKSQNEFRSKQLSAGPFYIPFCPFPPFEIKAGDSLILDVAL